MGGLTTTKAGSGGSRFYEITVTDNGCGMAHESIPEMLGVVLSGTKYGVKQTRGKFGLGAKMALIWAKASTGVPIEVYSAVEGAETISYYKLDIDIQANRPNIVEEKRLPNDDGWRGTKLVVTIEGTWQYRKRVLEYLRMLAIITPYAWFRLSYQSGKESTSFVVQYARRLNAELPPLAREVKHHPSSLNLILLNRLLSNCTPSTTLLAFLKTEFSSVSTQLGKKICGTLELDPGTKLKDLDANFVHHLVQAFQQVSIPEPSGKALSPAGEYNLYLGIKKELKPVLVATHQDRAHAYEGHAFVIEAGVSIGGDELSQGISVYRYANRIPLLFEPGNDVMTVTAQKFPWAKYKIRPTLDKIGVFISIVSTQIPFKGTGKEYVGPSKVMAKSITTALRACCLSLKKKIVSKAVSKTKVDRKRKLIKFIPDVSRSMFSMLSAIADASDERAAKRSKPLSAAAQAIVADVRSGEVTQDVLAAKLTTHVEKSDAEGALQFVADNAEALGAERSLGLACVGGGGVVPDVVLSKRGIVVMLSSACSSVSTGTSAASTGASASAGAGASAGTSAASTSAGAVTDMDVVTIE